MPMSANIFNVDLLEDFEANVLLEQLNETEEAGTALRTCHVCGSPINDVDSYECPFCGVIIKTAPKRKERAERTLLKTVESENKNGTYSIYRLQDGTFYCNCLSFLRQRGVKEESYGLTCKHIRNELPNLGFNLNSVSAEPVPVTSWQKVMLKKLGVVPHEKLSREQAYWIIRDSLDLIGVDYRDFISLVRENSTYELLPVRAYGVELEGLVRNRMELFNRMREEGYRVKLCGYNHEIDNNLWKVGDDGSVRRSMTDDERSNYESVELTSPKLFGDVGFRKISKALEIWNSIGSHVNNSCGFHVHIDLYDYDSDDLARLMLVWMKIEPIIYFLVSPSRRNNGFTIFMRRQYGDVLARLFWGSKNNLTRNDRYYTLNRVAYLEYGTVEFRVHQGTTKIDKVRPWVILCLKLVEKVKQGLKWYHFSDNPTIEEVLDKLGIVDNAIPSIREARKYFIERYHHFKSGSNGCDLPGLEFESLKNSFKNYLLARYNDSRYLVDNPKTHMEKLISDTRSAFARRIIPYEEVEAGRVDGNVFKVRPSTDSDRFYKVKFNPDTGTVSCTCRGYRNHGKCYHSSSVARYLFISQKIEKVSNNLNF